MIEELAAQEKETARLTHLAACGGCASKLSQSALADVLQGLPQYPDSRMLVGNATSDDAGVFRISEDQALVQTVDFFTPIVDDPFTFGQIAATNALSDVYAMGGRPLTALAITGMPDEALEPEVIREILRGGAEKAVEAQCSILGGHTIKNPQPIYGLACTGIVNPGCYMANAAARPGDVLVLTKPLGTGIITSGIKRGIAPESAVSRAIALMTTLNTAGAKIAEQSLSCCATEVTGFGLLGHLKSMCLASGVTARLQADAIPAIDDAVCELIEKHDCVPGGSRGNLESLEPLMAWSDAIPLAKKILMADAQTSGGLLLAIQESSLETALKLLQESGTPCQAVVGEIMEPTEAPHPLISVHSHPIGMR